MSYKKAILIFTGAFLSIRLLLIALPFDVYMGGLSTLFLIIVAFTPYILATVIFVRTNQKTFVRKEVWIMAVFSATLSWLDLAIDIRLSGGFEAMKQNMLLQSGQDVLAKSDIAFFMFVGFNVIVISVLVNVVIYHFAGKIAQKFLVKNPDTA